jgi:alpha-glucosidase
MPMATSFGEPETAEAYRLADRGAESVAIGRLTDRISPVRRSAFLLGQPHGEAEHQQPWRINPELEDRCRGDGWLHHRLAPYLYTLQRDVKQNGAPVLRPLRYHFPDDARTYQICDQAMLGHWMLIAPIGWPGQAQCEIYLPRGRWYDWWSGAAIVGPARPVACPPQARPAVYVRAGAAIPGLPERHADDDRPPDALALDLFPGNGGFTLYEDDGSACASERGRFCTTSYRLRADAERLRFSIGARDGAYAVPPRRVLLRVHGVGARVAEQHPGATYDSAQRLLTLRLHDAGRARQLEFALDG